MQLAFRLVLPLVLAVTLHTIPRLAFPLSSGSSSPNVPTTDIDAYTLPRSTVRTTPSYKHSANVITSEASFNVTGIKKYVFPVQDTNVVLTIHLGKRLDRISLGIFLDVTEDFVTTQVRRTGPDAILPMGMFEWDMGEDLQLFAESSLVLDHQMTWAILMNAIKGLQDFLIGLQNYREASCQVSLVGPARTFVGYLDLRTRLERPKTNVGRDVPTVLVVNHRTNSSTPRLDMDENVHIDIRPSWRRLDFYAVRNVLAVTQDWAEANIERTWTGQPIQGGVVERSLGEGVELHMVEALGKRLTYGLVLETVKRLLEWELSVGKGKAVEFGILDHGFLKGAGGIRKDKLRSLDFAR